MDGTWPDQGIEGCLEKNSESGQTYSPDDNKETVVVSSYNIFCSFTALDDRLCSG